jgi:hypothetical protein
MAKPYNGKLVAAGVALLLVAGIMRAVSGRYVERREAIMAACRNELKSAGLDASAVREKYPTPEVTLCRSARVAPGGVGEVVLRGTFRQGTKFLLNSDKVEVIKEAFNASAGQKESEYRATIKAAQTSLPDYIYIESYEPQLCRGTSSLAACIGGKYEWDFTADNGWKIQLRQLSASACKEGETSSLYRAEFFRSAGPRPFELRNVRVGCQQGRCSGSFEEGSDTAAAQQKMLTAMQNVSPEEEERSQQRVKELQAEMTQLQKKMQNFASLSKQDQQKLMARVQEISKEMAAAVTPKGVAEAEHEMAEKQAEFGCRNLSFELKGGALEGDMVCGEKIGSRGQLRLHGTTKFVGP